MLEAQVIIKDSTDGVFLKGDILVCALPGHPWGTLDTVHFLVVQWQDDALELQLQQRVRDGALWPVVAYPYAVKEAVVSRGGVTPLPVLTRGSSQTLDLSRVAWYTDATIAKPILTPDDYTLVAEATGGVIGTIKNAIVSAWKWMVG